MTELRLPYVHRFRDRHGKLRFYFRRGREKQVRLPGLPGSREFIDAYQAALDEKPLPVAAARTAPGTMAALAASWFQSAGWKNGRGPATQANQRRIVERFLAEHGHKPFSELEARHIRGFMDAKADTPAAANKLLSILRLMLRHGVERGMLTRYPTVGVRRLRYPKGGFATWTEADISAFEARGPIGSRARLAMSLMLFLGQRRSDVIRLGRQHIRGGAIEIRQAKTGAVLVLPIHPALRAAMDACPADHLTLLTTTAGKPFASGNAFYNWFKRCMAEAGLPHGLSPHGLRKAAARRLAEAGCTPHAIMAVTGHTTLAEVERYTRAADQERLAKGAVAKIGRRPEDT